MLGYEYEIVKELTKSILRNTMLYRREGSCCYVKK